MAGGDVTGLPSWGLSRMWEGASNSREAEGGLAASQSRLHGHPGLLGTEKRRQIMCYLWLLDGASRPSQQDNFCASLRTEWERRGAGGTLGSGGTPCHIRAAGWNWDKSRASSARSHSSSQLVHICGLLAVCSSLWGAGATNPPGQPCLLSTWHHREVLALVQQELGDDITQGPPPKGAFRPRNELGLVVPAFNPSV